jgi:transposase-like protein
LEEKTRIVAESLDPATTSSAVARHRGLHASQLFVWRQQLQSHSQQGERLARALDPILLGVLRYAAMPMWP